MRSLKLLLAALGLAAALAACGNVASGGGAADSNGCTPKGASAASPNAVVKVVTDPNTVGAFADKRVTIKAGQAVEWDWQDPNVQHTVTSDDGTSFDSCLQGMGSKFIVTFSKAGSVSYHCTIHPLMVGTVVVQS